jgi:hypothetical protein
MQVPLLAFSLSFQTIAPPASSWHPQAREGRGRRLSIEERISYDVLGFGSHTVEIRGSNPLSGRSSFPLALLDRLSAFAIPSLFLKVHPP